MAWVIIFLLWIGLLAAPFSAVDLYGLTWLARMAMH
jgi:hypothetical protein